MPVSRVGNGGTHFELGLVDGVLLEERDLTAEVARLFSAEVKMKRGRTRRGSSAGHWARAASGAHP